MKKTTVTLDEKELTILREALTENETRIMKGISHKEPGAFDRYEANSSLCKRIDAILGALRRGYVRDNAKPLSRGEDKGKWHKTRSMGLLSRWY